MRVIVTYNEQDIYDIPDERWREAMALCDSDEDEAFNLLMDEGIEDLCRVVEVTDRYVRVERV
jgi:hypothetical protein